MQIALQNVYGTFKQKSGTTYEGLYQNDQYNGRGKLNHFNGSLYIGEFKHNLADGFGIYR